MYRLSLRIDGEITIEAFNEAVENFLRLLREVERSVSGERTIKWTLQEMHRSSPAILTWEGTTRPRRRKRNEAPRPATDYAPVVGKALLSGVGKLERGEGRPESFSDDALDASKNLSRVQERKAITTLALIAENGNREHGPDVLNITGRVAASVKEIIEPKSVAPGAVEGILQIINSRGELYFIIYDMAYGTRVRCDVPASLKRKAIDSFDERVLVTGMVSRDAEGHPRYVRVQGIETVETDALPQSIRGLDPDFTGDLSSAEYVKRGWPGADA